ncbi:hypothetical protein MLD38_018681 [Melastoma candidum]|uniref:Uncharacterized protein n=1 Tax=Melastoma candidum TaxID=119954 RepID=A0ACB9QUH6_9MYRT|nr:hypothetical protein MLD38_018681 [Melastoma candidum]
MASYVGGFHIALIVSVCFLMARDVASGLNTDFLYRICNGNRFPPDWHEKDFPAQFVWKIVRNTPYADGYEYYTDKVYYAIHFYGHGVCTQGLPQNECSQCLYVATDNLWKNCDTSVIGAQIQLRDCRIRYEEYHFNNDGFNGK